MNAAYYMVLGLAVALEGLACSAQTYKTLQSLPDAQTRVNLALAGDNTAGKAAPNFHLGPTLARAGIVTSAPPPPPRIVDSKFFLLNGIHLGMAVFDVEMTQRCIASHHCREVNPTMPSSQAGQLGVNFAILAYSSGLSYWLKKRGSNLWRVIPLAGAAVHSYGVATGFEHQ